MHAVIWGSSTICQQVTPHACYALGSSTIWQEGPDSNAVRIACLFHSCIREANRIRSCEYRNAGLDGSLLRTAQAVPAPRTWPWVAQGRVTGCWSLLS